MPTFDEWLTVTASTKRSPAAEEGGTIGTMEDNLDELLIMPLMPVDPEILETVGLSGPREAKQTFCEDADVEEGDRLVVAGVEYVVRAVAEWPWADSDTFLHLIVEELK